MSDNAPNSSNVTVSVPRNALLVAGGAALVGVGIAAGVMFKGHSAPKNEAADVAAPAVVASAPVEAASATAQAPAASSAEQQAQASAPAKEKEVVEAVAPVHKEAKKTAKAKHATESSPTTAAGATPAPQVVEQPRVICATCGTVESVNAVHKRGQGSGLGAVAGGVLGGVLGNQMGKGNGKTAMTVLGAIGGGLAGNEVEKNQRATTVYEVTIRMDDGSTRTLTENSPPAVGARVDLSGQGGASSQGGAGAQDLRP